MLNRYDRHIFELASCLVLDWDMQATFYAAAKLENCLKAGDDALALMWLDVIRAVEAMSDTRAGSFH